ncbi:MAG: hypothetical protein DBX38_00755 [Eubacteriales Family XIII. Incertae Sedis bacterium]|nr:MAG: hypothetical protein DBX38_00755 [Clostridiales Family XIII bacterium]
MKKEQVRLLYVQADEKRWHKNAGFYRKKWGNLKKDNTKQKIKKELSSLRNKTKKDNSSKQSGIVLVIVYAQQENYSSQLLLGCINSAVHICGTIRG